MPPFGTTSTESFAFQPTPIIHPAAFYCRCEGPFFKNAKDGWARPCSPQNDTPDRRPTGVCCQKTQPAANSTVFFHTAAGGARSVTTCYNGCSVIGFILSLFAVVGVYFRSRADTALEVLALCQELAVLKRRRRRPPLSRLDTQFWIALQDIWARWKDVLVIVKPKTRLASRRFPPLSAVAVPAARWPAEDHRGDPSAHPAPRAGKPRLGRAENPRRAPEARLRGLGKDRRTVFAAHSEAIRPNGGWHFCATTARRSSP